jgi:hypothetical protein
MRLLSLITASAAIRQRSWRGLIEAIIHDDGVDVLGEQELH